MISEEKIKELLSAKFENTELFLVDLNVDLSNNIKLAIDTPKGISIAECKEVNRFLEQSLDREQEDFSIMVSSPDLNKPFRVHKQYLKNKGREVEVEMEDVTLKGILKNVTEEQIEIEYLTIRKEKNKKIKEMETKVIPFDQIKKTKAVISFKK